MEYRKQLKYPNIKVLPFAVEAHGRLGESAFEVARIKDAHDMFVKNLDLDDERDKAVVKKMNTKPETRPGTAAQPKTQKSTATPERGGTALRPLRAAGWPTPRHAHGNRSD